MNNDPFYFVTRTAVDMTKGLAQRYARVPGVHILVRSDRCTGCGACVRKGFCRVGAISVVEKKATVNDQVCRGCARCTHLCPRNALAIELRPPRVVRDGLRKVDDTVGKLI